MHSPLPLFAMLTAAAVALPNLLPPPTCSPVTDNFDDRVANGVDPLLSPVGAYHGVTYESFNVVAVGLDGTVLGIRPSSGQNTAGTGIATQLTSIGNIALFPFGYILATPSTAFDLSSFSFGCAINTETVQVPTPTSCIITVTGFNVDGQQLPAETFTFVPTNVIADTPAVAVLPPSYTRLQNITIGLTGSVMPALSVLVIDDVQRCTYT
ncbi:hypothetical protein F4778DRAFT_796575 [Xylariomycetidae sp. FL2044]|nr:hypothetical protein F4778DRAFT_796575 [Xylariomycetidae sp. FL2044]